MSEPRFRVAHGLRLKGFAAPAALADVVGLAQDEVEMHLAGLEADGRARYRDGRITGWSLTGDGRKLHHEACSAELATTGSSAAIHDAYRRFLDLNAALLSACTDWQLRSDAAPGTQVLNTHLDPDYDRAVIERLGGIDDRVQPVVADLGAVLARFARYAERLARARTRVEAGAHEWFTGSTVESYHAVWFELHEDLLVTLAIERASEPAL